MIFYRFISCERGAAILEYALLAALMSVIATVGASQLEQSVDKLFRDVTKGLRSAR